MRGLAESSEVGELSFFAVCLVLKPTGAAVAMTKSRICRQPMIAPNIEEVVLGLEKSLARSNSGNRRAVRQTADGKNISVSRARALRAMISYRGKPFELKVECS